MNIFKKSREYLNSKSDINTKINKNKIINKIRNNIAKSVMGIIGAFGVNNALAGDFNTNRNYSNGLDDYYEYKVQSGDTLSEIASRHGFTLDEVLEKNPKLSSRKDNIYVGESINIRNINNTYKVQSGDTLSQIASRYGLTLDTILEYNPELSSRKDSIYIGESINTGKPINGLNIENITSKESANDSNYDNNITHIVSRGENLWRIVLESTNSVDKANSLDNFIIYPNDVVYISNNNVKIFRNGNKVYSKNLEVTNVVTNITRNISNNRPINKRLLNYNNASNDADYNNISNNFESSRVLGTVLSNNYNLINDEYKNPGRCGANVRGLLNAFGLNNIPSYGMHGYRYIDVLNNLVNEGKLSKVRISNPNDALPGAILVYNKGYGRAGTPRYKYGHVEVKSENGYFWGGLSRSYGGSITGANNRTGFTGYAYYINDISFNAQNNFFRNNNLIASNDSFNPDSNNSLNSQNKTVNNQLNNTNNNINKILANLRQSNKIDSNILSSLEEKVSNDPEIIKRTILNRISQLERIKVSLQKKGQDEVTLRRVINNLNYFNGLLDLIEDGNTVIAKAS